MKTYQPKKEDVKRGRHLIDADGQVLGRMSTEIVKLLMGKNKPSYSRHMDVGDFVTVKNAGKVKLTGKKESQKVYYRHSGYPGGLKEISLSKLKKERPQRIIELAVKRMLPKNRLRDIRMARLKVVVGDKK
jgi:large subunit ribosomal protein L13